MRGLVTNIIRHPSGGTSI